MVEILSRNEYARTAKANTVPIETRSLLTKRKHGKYGHAVSFTFESYSLVRKATNAVFISLEAQKHAHTLSLDESDKKSGK